MHWEWAAWTCKWIGSGGNWTHRNEPIYSTRSEPTAKATDINIHHQTLDKSAESYTSRASFSEAILTDYCRQDVNHHRGVVMWLWRQQLSALWELQSLSASGAPSLMRERKAAVSDGPWLVGVIAIKITWHRPANNDRRHHVGDSGAWRGQRPHGVFVD